MSADRADWSKVYKKPEVCTPYQVAFPNGYCKNIIGYQPIYGTNQPELQHNEDRMTHFNNFLESSGWNSTKEGILIKVKDKSFIVRQSCLDMVDDVYCHHYFKRCYMSSKPPLICRETCEELFSNVCYWEYKVVKFINSKSWDIINCTTLPFRNASPSCFYPDKIRGQ